METGETVPDEIDEIDEIAVEPEFVLDAAEGVIEHTYVALKDFSARVRSQIVNFVEGANIGHDPGAYLAARGAPIQIQEDL